MPDEPSLFGPAARRDDPDTSKEAGSLPRRFPWRVLLMACRLGEFHDGLLAEHVGKDRNIVARRRLDLQRHDPPLVVPAIDGHGERITCIGDGGVRVQVWRVTEDGIELMRRRVASREGEPRDHDQ